MLACRPGLGAFFIAHGLVDEVVEIDKSSWTGRRAALARLRRTTWDVVLVPHQSVRTALWMRRLHARRAKVGFAQWWNRGFFQKRVPPSPALPDALRQLSLMVPLDAELERLFQGDDLQRLRSPVSQASPLDLRAPTIPPWASMRVLENRPAGRRIFMAPGSVWATKQWTATGYVELARLIQENRFAVELVGSAAERGLCEAIAGQVEGVRNRAGQTSLAELAELLRGGVALVCNDSGAMHAAAAVGLPTVAIFGPTTLALGFRPWNQRSLVVQRELSCRPCGKHGAQRCPLGTHACMREISVAQVWSAVQALLGHN